jgi:hypothetical protein
MELRQEWVKECLLPCSSRSLTILSKSTTTTTTRRRRRRRKEEEIESESSFLHCQWRALVNTVINLRIL